MRNDTFESGKTARLIGACLFAAVCAAPVAAQAQAQPNLVFGTKSSQPGLLNRMFGGASDPEPATQAGGAPASGQGAAQGSGQPAGHGQQAAADEGTNGDSPFPKQYLLNKMFSRDSLGLEPEAPAPTPAAKTP
jgi:hypothetical protein